MKRLLFAFVTLASTAMAGDFSGEAGLQLYSLRGMVKKDDPASIAKLLDQAKAFGVKKVEVATTYHFTPTEYKKELAARGLVPVSAHYGYERYDKELPKIAEEAKTLGLEYVGVAWIPHVPAMFNQVVAEKAAADFNKWGEELAKQGLKFFYHCHGYEFKPIVDGEPKTYMDVLMEKTKPEFVSFEMDVFWVVNPGADPVKYLEKYPGRWQQMHLKDISKTARVGVYLGQAPLTDDVTIGTGRVDWPAVLRAATKAGVKHYYIEDESPTVLEQVPKSLKYLETLK
jgi:sugar phosphate isomerase/epimerase